MRIRVNKKFISFRDIFNESQMEMIDEVAEKSGCVTKYSDYSTVCKVSGNLDKFIKVWNER